MPLVLAADVAMPARSAKPATFGPLLAGIVDTNPQALNDSQLHDAAYAIMQPRLDATRQDAVEQFTALQGQNDERPVAEVSVVVRATVQSRVGILLLRLDRTLWGRSTTTPPKSLSPRPATRPVRTCTKGSTAHPRVRRDGAHAVGAGPAGGALRCRGPEVLTQCPRLAGGGQLRPGHVGRRFEPAMRRPVEPVPWWVGLLMPPVRDDFRCRGAALTEGTILMFGVDAVGMPTLRRVPHR